MPRPELPGFYWDDQKCRYFPLSSRPAGNPAPVPTPLPAPATTAAVNQADQLNQNRLPWRTFQLARQSHDVAQRSRLTEEILSSHYASTSRFKQTWIPTSGRIRAFCTTSFRGAHRRFIGDDQGWLYACVAPEVEEQDMISDLWLAELVLHPASEITSICISGSKCIATCLGPSPRISVQDLNIIGRTYLLGLNGIHDIWNAHLEGNSLVIGADKRAVYLHDIDVTTQLKYLDTQSDVFAVYHHENLVYTGARNGSITRFDLRLKTYGHKLCDDRFGSGPRSTVLHLGVVNEYQLVTSQMNGELATYDLRFTRPTSPLIRYNGHVNTHSRKLGIAIDPSEQFLYAAGEDGRIRGWSLNTGTPIVPPTSESTFDTIDTDDGPRLSNPFKVVFPHAVQAMQVTSEKKGLCLWAASDEDLYRYHLGQQADPA
ncbi:hypothetical protein AX15_003780 [Amanita polypyramis BW_CC]|nr:hypothetical protein AX15_003780 [Amanita polypyramis BW_CC]